MQEGKRVGIHGIGIYLPEPVRKNDWWPQSIVETWAGKSGASLLRSAADSSEPIAEGVSRALEGMAEVAADPFKGAVERRVMPDGMVTSDMEAAAAKDALSRAGIDPGEVGMLLLNSQLPDFLSVPTAPAVHRKLGLPERCLSMATDAACNSFLTQLAIAEPMIRSGQVRYTLLVQSSGFLHLARPEDQHSAWFGDAATAVVVGPAGAGRGILGRAHRTDGSMYNALVTGCPGVRWYSGQQPVLYVDDVKSARRMLLSVADRGKQVVGEALAEAGCDAEHVRFYASHQGTRWFRKVTQEHIGLVNARYVDTFPWTGSLGAANIPMVLGTAEREGLLKAGDLVATYAGGSGVTWSSVVLRWGT